MTSNHQARKYRLGRILGILLSLCLTSVSSHEAAPSNYRSTPDASTLKIEARESGASVVLGKDLVLGSTKTSVASSSNSSDDVASTDSAAASAIVGRVPSFTGEYDAGSAARKTAKDASPDVTSRYYAGKNPKIAWRKDSYLEALRHSRTSDDPREGIVRVEASRREYTQQGPVYRPETEYGPPDDVTYPSKSPRIIYGTPGAAPSPSANNGAPQNSYGPPAQNSYGPPTQNSYGPPSYGSPYPPPQQEYGPAVPYPAYGAPYALSDVSHISILPSFDLGLPFALKLNAFTIAKIILKLVIFKMIVKFIAVICLLLFLPKLEIIKKKVVNKDDDEEERGFASPYATPGTLRDLERTVGSSVEKYEGMQGDARSNSAGKCGTLACRVADALAFHESWDRYVSLFKSYAEEESQFAGRGREH